MARTGAVKKKPAKPAAKLPAKLALKPGAKAMGRPPARKRRGNGGAILTLAIIGITALAVVALPIGILLIAGLPPTAVAVVVDRHAKRYLARTVGAMNLAGVLPSALHMWEAGISFSSLGDAISNPYTWLVMYGAAGIGWLLYFGVPPVVGMVIEVRADDQKRRLEARAKTLVDEWGEEVTGRQHEG